MDRKRAIGAIADGHAIYSEGFANEVCEFFGAKPIAGQAMYSDPKGTHKGLTMKTEGEVCIGALSLGSHISGTLGLEVRSFLGRGTQGRAYAQAIAEATGE